MRPLDRIPSIKVKLGLAVVAAVAVSSIVSYLGFVTGLDILWRPLISTAIALVMVQLLARGMTSPLREMAAAATAMARGDHSRRVRATARDEVGQLAEAFNRMAAELAETDRQRRDLVANASHELRTPIAALQAQLENLVDGVGSAEPDVLATMLGQVERLSGLVNQLLDLSKLESGTVPLQRRTVAVEPLLRQAVDEARLRNPDRTVALAVEPEDLEVDADPVRLHQVVTNLLENAERYSPNGESIDVAARPGDRTVTIEVLDHGPGIPPDEADRVFERFYRADHARASAQGGAGLGLSIARWIVDLHGGDIRAEARAPTGCRMVLSLPTTAQEAPR
ncbi:MAG TPA: ATP-binding protein [Acidimicrobiales bacterium]|nr:ATP-binding protein [Acidimicrobiales bacterium]